MMSLKYARPVLIPAIAAILLVSPRPASAEFVGELNLSPDGCEATRYCMLEQELGYVDPAGIGWQARKGLLTDGASIPPWAQPFVGEPFEAAFLKAAIIHDHYCDRRVRPWRQTHRVFYEALRESGVEAVKAGIMYFAVLVGGPKWAKLVKGKPCPVGMGCINSLELSATVPGSGVAVGTSGDLFVARTAEYDTARFADIMRDEVPRLEEKGDELTVAEIEELAADVMGDDFYFTNGDEIGSELELKVE